MTYETAKEIVAGGLAFFDPTNAIFRSINQIEDEDERSELMVDVEMITKHSTALIFKAIKKYPDLNPFK